jgi:hypothetical protein
MDVIISYSIINIAAYSNKLNFAVTTPHLFWHRYSV